MTSRKKIINIAILAEEPLGWGSGKHYFPVILNHYRWKKNQKEYEFKTKYIYDKDILDGRLKDFNLLLCPGGGVGDGQAVMKGLKIFPKSRKWKKEILRYIQNGGSYFGICGGVACFTALDKGNNNKPETYLEKLYNKSNVKASCVKHFYKDLAFPMLYLFQRKHPEKIGATGYVFSFRPGITTDGRKIHTGGVPVDFNILSDDPIFADYKKENIRIRWWGGPALTVPDKTGRDIKVIARYPKQDFSKESGTSIKAWSYNGGILGLFKAFLKSLKYVKKYKMKDILMYTYFLARPWKKSQKNIVLDYADKASITKEIYPNENKGRIVLCTSHPEYMVWWGGYIDEVRQDKNVCLGKGLHQWKDIKPLSKNIVEELSYTWWLVRRLTAWAAKIPDENLPPIHKEKINKEIRDIIENNILWDETLQNQIKNI